MKVTCETELVKVDGRALTFSVKAYDEAGLIGEGEHERFIIFEEKFQAKADAKLQASISG
jgi:predicted thioesterase